MATLQIPSFSLPTNRTDFTSITNMLTNFFVSQGFKQSDAVAQAGLVLNLKQQGYSDAQINTAIQTQQNTLNSIAANQAAQAAAALAAEQPKVAAALELMKKSTLEHATSGSENVLINVGGVTETRAQATNFAEKQSGCMEADPDNPRGPKITCAEAALKRQRALSASFSNSSVANLPATSKVVAINGVPVTENTTKPQMLGTSTPITDVSKTLTQVVQQSQTDLANKTPSPATVPETSKPSTDPIKQLTDYISNLFSPITKPTSEAITATEKTLSDAISATQKTIGTAESQAVTDVQKTFADTLAAAEKAAADLAAAGTKTVTESVSSAQKQASDLIANAEASFAGLLGKLTGLTGTVPDLSKTTSAPTLTTSPTPTPTPTPTPKTPPETKPTLAEQTKTFFKKYSFPIIVSVAAAGAIGSLAVVMSHNSKQGIIAR